MNFWPLTIRKNPYTQKGLRRLVCVRCGAPAVHQWTVCADKNNYRPMCLSCDIGLNEVALTYMKHPDAKNLVDAYKKKQLGDQSEP